MLTIQPDTGYPAKQIGRIVSGATLIYLFNGWDRSVDKCSWFSLMNLIFYSSLTKAKEYAKGSIIASFRVFFNFIYLLCQAVKWSMGRIASQEIQTKSRRRCLVCKNMKIQTCNQPNSVPLFLSFQMEGTWLYFYEEQTFEFEKKDLM